ncbi:MAG: tRNA uridine-5-carboxymethylaminomethyl(34) synthesis enzyme MnmG [Tenericutes bacterium]|nr:MAG: tRNA uridine-5-carboxymethylaminomethyl(34) synthesis enzyme MnmG [Mycoplasmatota bacterium]
MTDNKKITGVKLASGKTLESHNVVVATGTFLESKVMIGNEITSSGPDMKPSSIELAKSIKSLDIKTIKLKTGTPPRVKINSLDLDQFKLEPGSDKPLYFTEMVDIDKKYQNIDAWIAHTNEETHKIIEDNITKSYLFSEEMNGAGPRYCPSIEDKVKRFADKERHQIFVELESESLDTAYLAGMSSSMPKDVQDKFINSIKGMENAVIEKYAYAIEYDAIDPTQLRQTLELKEIEGLYFVGQVNGTSGYEEAAAQGIIAGINISNKIDGKDEFILRRDQSYIGVMIDDITTKGIEDPYRLLTSRAEYRLLLRTDNTVKRLFDISSKLNLLDAETLDRLGNNLELMNNTLNLMKEVRINSSSDDLKNIEISIGSMTLTELAKRPELKLLDYRELIEKYIPEAAKLSDQNIESIEVEIMFEGYISKQEKEIRKYKKNKSMKLSESLDYSTIDNLSLEAIEKLTKFKPTSIHQASMLSGIKPSDIVTLIHNINKKENK